MKTMELKGITFEVQKAIYIKPYAKQKNIWLVEKLIL